MALSEERRKQLDGIVSQMASNKEPDSNVQFVVNDFKSKYENESTAPKQKKSIFKTVVDGLGNVIPTLGQGIIGAAKGVGSTVAGASALGERMLSFGQAKDTLGEQLQKSRTLTPQNTAQKVGFGIEKAAEFLAPIPGMKAARAGLAAKAITEGGQLARFGKSALNLAGRATLEGAENVARSALQKGSLKDAGSDFGIGAAFPILGAAVRGAGRVGSEVLGATTGAGGAAIKQAFRDGSPEFVQALRGNVDETNGIVLGKSRDALHSIKEDMSSAYRQRFEALKTQTKEIPIDDIKSSVEKKLQNYGVKVTEDGLDFSRSTIADKAEAGRVNDLVAEVAGWGQQAGDLTAVGLDTLKRRLDDFYSPSGQARALVTSLRNDVKKKIVKEFPEYEKMTGDYEKTVGLIKEIENSLSLKTRASADTAIRKLTSVLRDNNEYRRKLLADLETASGENLGGQLAGASLSGLAPKGLMKPLTGVGALGAVSAGSLLNPALWGAAAMASPRLVGEFTRALGIGSRFATKTGLVEPAKQVIKSRFAAE